jgi:hypothetical protein
MSFAKSYELSQVMNFASIFENVLASFQSLFHKPIKSDSFAKKTQKETERKPTNFGRHTTTN